MIWGLEWVEDVPERNEGNSEAQANKEIIRAWEPSWDQGRKFLASIFFKSTNTFTWNNNYYLGKNEYHFPISYYLLSTVLGC